MAEESDKEQLQQSGNNRTAHALYASRSIYAPINVKPHLPPLGQWMGEGGALAQIWSRETAPWVGLLTRAYLERFRRCA